MQLPYFVRQLFGIEQETTTGVGLLKSMFGIDGVKPKAKRVPGGKEIWWRATMPDGNVKMILAPNDKSQARARVKAWLHVERLPPGTRVVREN